MENRYSYKFIMCQEPDLNWWHEDFQSSALPAELSRPFLTRHLNFKRLLKYMSMTLCQLKKKDENIYIRLFFLISVGVMIMHSHEDSFLKDKMLISTFIKKKLYVYHIYIYIYLLYIYSKYILRLVIVIRKRKKNSTRIHLWKNILNKTHNEFKKEDMGKRIRELSGPFGDRGTWTLTIS